MLQIRWIWRNLKGDRARYIVSLVFTAILSSMVMFNSIIIEQIIDEVFTPLIDNPVITREITDRLFFLVALLIGYTFIRTTLAYFNIMNFEVCSQNMVYRIRSVLYDNMQSQDIRFYGRNRTGDLMTRLSGDLDMVRHATAWIARMLIDSVVIFVCTAVLFVMRDPLFALSLLAITPIILVLTIHFSKKVRPLYVDLREKLSGINTQAQENISGNRVVKAFAKEEHEIMRFEEKNRAYRDANCKATLMWLRFFPIIDALSQSLFIAVLLVGGIFLINGRITLGTFSLFNGLIFTLSNPMKTMGMLLNDLQRFIASSSKVIELFYERSTIQSRSDAVVKNERLKGDIRFENVNFSVGDVNILRDINLDIKAGETVAVMGPTGSGKTALVNLIVRFQDVSSGNVYVDDVPVNLYEKGYLRENVGMATQDVFLFSDTVDSNIAYGDPDLSREEVEEFAEAASVDFIDKLPEGFETIVGERGTGLSGGQKQRIALARALAVRPAILILDDTTSAVDLETEKEIQNAIDDLDFKSTKIIIAQRISTTKRADKIVILQDGRIADCGTHDELINRPGYYQEVYSLQNILNEEGNSGTK